MTEASATPLFVDTGAFYARFDESASRHDSANGVFEGIGAGERPYRPVYTSTYVLDELATLVLSHCDHETAQRSLDRVLDSSVIVVHPDETDFRAAYDQFSRYRHDDVSFTDHMTAVLAAERGISHVFSFDTDFRALDFTVVPIDTGEA